MSVTGWPGYRVVAAAPGERCGVGWPVTLDPRPPASSQRGCASPVATASTRSIGGGVGRVAVAVEPPAERTAWRAPGARRATASASVGSIAAARSSSSSAVVAQQARGAGEDTADVAAGDVGRAAAAARGAPGCDRNRGSWFDGSSRRLDPSAAHSVSVSERRRARIGCARPGLDRGEPVAAGARAAGAGARSRPGRRRCGRSSPSGGSTARRAARARASRFGPWLDVRRRRTIERNAETARRSARAASASSADSGAEPVVDVVRR